MLRKETIGNLTKARILLFVYGLLSKEQNIEMIDKIDTCIRIQKAENNKTKD